MSMTRTLAVLLFLMLISTACGGRSGDGEIAFLNATIWTGDDASTIRNGALIIRNGKVEEVIDLDRQELPDVQERIDLKGSYIIPGLINAHGHVGSALGLETGPSIHSRENVLDQLRLYARYGITTVVSLGDEPPQAFDVRHQEDPVEMKMARFFLSGPVLNPSDPVEARREVRDRAEQNPDWTKIRADDNLGRNTKMSPDIYQAIIETSHEHGIPHASHIVTLEDAKDLVRKGTDLIAHSVRDQPVDQELITLMLDAGICITPTLTREISTFIYRDRPEFFDDPFFLREADPEVIRQLLQPEIQQRYLGAAPDYYMQALPLARENMMTLHRAGVPVAMGTDSGPPGRFQGYFEHMEMEMMQESGMSPLEVLLSATSRAARCMGLEELGRLAPGKAADFILLDENPLEDVRNLRSLRSVYIGGQKIPEKG